MSTLPRYQARCAGTHRYAERAGIFHLFQVSLHFAGGLDSLPTMRPPDQHLLKGRLRVRPGKPPHAGPRQDGKTQRPTAERLAELSQHTGVPGDFLLAYEHQFSDCDLVEQSVHGLLAAHRLPDKEFFQITVQQAIEAILQSAKD